MANDPRVQAAEPEAAKAAEAEIAVHWKEESFIFPSPKFIGQANLTDPSITQRFRVEVLPRNVELEPMITLRPRGGMRAALHAIG